MTPSEFQRDIGVWCLGQFGEPDPFKDALAIAEEAGEVCRAVLKRDQADQGTNNRKGTPGEWNVELVKEAADTLIALLSLADNEGFDLFGAARERFEEVRTRKAQP